MNRRTLIAGAVPLPWIQKKPELPQRRLRSQLLLNDVVSVQILLEAHATAESAEVWRQGWIGRAFEGMGEWYLQDSESRDLPARLAALPGDMHFHNYIWGEAAEEDSMLIGAFRHEHVGCVIRMQGEHEPLMISLAEFFASRAVPNVWELAWSDAQLQRFLPTSDSLGIPVQPDNDAFWP